MALVFVAGALTGLAYEHYVGVRSVLEWAGIDHWPLRLRLASTQGRTVVASPAPKQGRTMVALVFGQSNAANSGETARPGHPGVYEFHRGRIYAARDPLLEAEGRGGSIWMPLAARLIEAGTYDRVVLVPIAVGSTEIARWAPGGNLHGWLLSVVTSAHAAGLEFTHLLWQQGETDASLGTSTEAYRARFEAMLGALRAAGANAPIHVAQSTRCGRVPPADPIRDAQRGLVDAARGILAGPDTDALGRDLRYDGCHFSHEGLERAAALWQAALAAPAGK